MLKFEKLYEKVGLFTLNVLADFGRHNVRKIEAEKPGDLQADYYFVNKDAPTVVFFHGGNWRSYKKEDYRFVADTLCPLRVTVLIRNLLKYPEYRFTALLEKAFFL